MGLRPEDIKALFVQEAETRLTRLGRLLMELEQHGSDRKLVDDVFRELHTIKGSAALAGMADVSTLAHDLEDLLDEVRAGRRTIDSDAIDRLLSGTDGLARAIAGKPALPPEAEPLPADPEPEPLRQGQPAGSDREPIGPQPPSAVSPNAAPAAASPRPADEGRAPVGDGGSVLVSMDRLDELVRLVGESAAAHLRVGRMLTERFGADPASLTEFNELSRSVNDLQDRAMRTRMVPVATITDQLQRAVRDLARAQGKDVRWETRGTDTELDRGVLNRLSDSLLHLVRNAVDHGIETPDERLAAGKPAQGVICLHAMQLGSEVIITVVDDGRGIDMDAVRKQAARQGVDTDALTDDEILELTFRSGLSTTSFITDVSGRGVGLDVVRTNVEAARGRVELRSQPASGSEFRIIVPITLAVLRCLLVEAGGQRFALPFHRVVQSQPQEEGAGQRAEGRPVIVVDGRPVPTAALSDILGVESVSSQGGPIVVLADTAHRHAFQVDRLVGQRDVVLKGLSRLLPHLPAVAGASVEPDGSVLVVLDPPGLIQRARQTVRGNASPTLERERPTRQRVLVVDDALTVRELQRNILERAGFDVRVAADGLQALARLSEEPVDLVLTDVEMPNLDGFTLTQEIRSRPDLANIPVLILTSRTSEADRQKGMDAGADGYIVKSGFDEGALLTAVHRLIGERA